MDGLSSMLGDLPERILAIQGEGGWCVEKDKSSGEFFWFRSCKKKGKDACDKPKECKWCSSVIGALTNPLSLPSSVDPKVTIPGAATWVQYDVG